MTSIGFTKQFDKNVSSIIAQFVTPIPKKFLNWIDTNKLDWYCVCRWVDDSILFDFQHKLIEEHLYSLFMNENAIFFIEERIKNKMKNSLFRNQISVIDWAFLSSNKNAIHILKQNKDQVFFHKLCRNENAIAWLGEITNNFTEKMYQIDWSNFCQNPNAVPIIEQLLQQNKTVIQNLNWTNLCKNPNAVDLCEKYLSYTNFGHLCCNPNAIPLLQKLTKNFTNYINPVDLYKLTSNPNAISIIEQHWNKNKSDFLDTLNWVELCENPNAADFIYRITNGFTTYFHKIKWASLWSNPTALPLLMKYNSEGKFYYNSLSWNPGIIELDSKRYKQWLNVMTKDIYQL